MKEIYLKFLIAISVNRIGKTGAVLTTTAFATFIVLEIPRLLGILTNAYFGLITYLLLPTLFVLGLALIPLGLWKFKKETGKSLAQLTAERFEEDHLAAQKIGSVLFRTLAIFTTINVLFLSFASFRTLKFMDGAEFCGTACHSVMNPEWTTYQQSPHARVKCVECHVGEGVDALIASKLNGAWQMISVTFDLLERPIPAPVHNLRPARETCEKCHWPEKFYGSRLKTISTYKKDETSTPLYTTLNLKIDTGTDVGKAGIHWHVGTNNKVCYKSSTQKRDEMVWVEALQPDGTFKRFTNTNSLASTDDEIEIRTMDCVDCHNRATHIYQDPGKAIDEKITSGLIDRALPFIKREALYSITNNYSSKEKAFELIDNYLNRFYRKNYPDLANSKSAEIDLAIKALQAVYERNIHPEMNIEWGSYPNHIGHDINRGCFRCHNKNMVDENNNAINYECTLCHSILAYDSDEAFKFLKPVDIKDKDAKMHLLHQEEFLNSVTN